MFKTASRLTFGALLVSTVACGEVIYEEETWEDWQTEGSELLNLDADRAAVRGTFGPLTAPGRATSASGWIEPAYTSIEVRDDTLENGGASAFTFIDVMDGLLQTAEPGTVYYNAYSEGDKALIDDAGDSYVRVDDDTPIVNNDDVDVMACGEGTTNDGVELSYDEPAEEVMLQVEVLDTVERPVDNDELTNAFEEDGREGQGEGQGEGELEDELDSVDAAPEMRTVEIIEVRVTARVMNYDDWGNASGDRIVNTKFVMER